MLLPKKKLADVVDAVMQALINGFWGDLFQPTRRLI